MNPQHLETLTKAKQTAHRLVGDVREAQRQAAESDLVLDIVLREALGEARKLLDRLALLEGCFPETPAPV